MPTTIILVAVVIFAAMLVEAIRASRNERVQLARGGVEPRGDVYRVMRVAYPGAFFAMIVEGYMRGGPPQPALIAGVVLFVAAKMLKWWAIIALGPSWTFKVIVVPGARLVTGGPYRHLRHPNYVSVAAELVAALLMTGAWMAGPIVTAGFLLLIARRIPIERRALEQGEGQSRGVILHTPAGGRRA